MNTFIENLNQWGGDFLRFGWPMLWQASLLIIILFGLDYLGRRHLRASVRYTLWLVVLVKLCLPPTLALPTSPVWWLHKTQSAVAPAVIHHYSVTYDQDTLSETLAKPVPDLNRRVSMTTGAGMLVGCITVSTALLLWLLVRWGQVTRRVRRAITSERLNSLTRETQNLAGMNFPVQAKVTTNSMSPAVCGLFKPVILIPDSLVDTFSDEQLRAVLLHELIHLRRRDVWINFLQALLQIVYWWHPLVWLANARIRSAREEAVDDAVVLALRDEAENYAPTLLAVAKLALRRPLVSLGLVGIMESRHALRQRIERLLDARTPRRTGLTLASLLGVLAFTAVAVPMGDAPAAGPEAPPANEPHRQAVLVTAEFYALPNGLILTSHTMTSDITFTRRTTMGAFMGTFKEAERAAFEAQFKTPGLRPFSRLSAKTSDGEESSVFTDDGTNGLKFTCCPRITDGGVKLAFSAEITGSMKGTPDSLSGLKVSDHVLAEDREGIYLYKDHLMLVIGVKLVTNSPPTKTSQNSPAINTGSASLTQSQSDSQVRTEMAQKPAKPQVHIKARFLEVPAGTWDSLEKFPIATTNGDDAVVGILTSQQQKTQWLSLQRSHDVYNYAEPEVTTTTERQTQMRATTIVEVITNVTCQVTPNGSNSYVFATVRLETGPIIDTIGKVLPDGYTIDLKVLASLTEFLGYDTSPTNRSEAFIHVADGHVPMGLPDVQIRRASTVARLWDGQTVAFGKFAKHRFAGDRVIAVGPDEKGTELLVLITVWIVNPAGNRIHSDDQLSFAQNAIPPQTVAGQKPIFWQTFGGSASKAGD